MGNKVVLLVMCYWLVIFSNSVEGLKIAAYNVRTFGETKLKNEVAMNMITQVPLTMFSVVYITLPGNCR